MKKIVKQFIEYFYPAIIIFFLLLFKYINFTQFFLGYLGYCIIIYMTTKTYLFCVNTTFNMEVLKRCPSIKYPNFKQYFLFPFTIAQFFLLQISSKQSVSNQKKLYFEIESVDNEGTELFWPTREKSKYNHNNPVLFVMPGITGKCSDPYVKNIICEGLNKEFDVVIFQMRTLSHEMRMPKDGYVNLCEDINNSLQKVREKNKNRIYAIGYSYGANLLTTYLGSKNLETNYICAGISVSNPFDFFISQRVGGDTIYESLILKFERRNYIPVAKNINKYEKDKKRIINIDYLSNALNMKQFDSEFFVKILGYRNADDYYKGISSGKYIKNINKPFLIISSKDDPISFYKSIPMDDICDNENIIFILTDRGAHSCYVENDRNLGFTPKQWMFKPTFEFLEFLRNNKNCL